MIQSVGSIASGVSVSNGRTVRKGQAMSRSLTTTEPRGGRPPIHPGEILADELSEIGITPTELARQLEVPANRITQIVRGKRAITGDTALRLGH